MKKSLIMVLAVLIIGFSGCVKDLEKENFSETTTLIGRVIEESSQKPIAGVKVSITNGSRTYVSCTTEEDGNFELKVDFDKIDKDYYLLMDGGTTIKTKKNELHGMGMEMYDYTNVILYNALETDGLSVVSFEINSFTAYSADCKAEIIAGTDVTVTKRGFCWSSSNQNPTISNHAIENGLGAGEYTGKITGLSEKTKYYVRGYAQTNDTVVYGEMKSFTTKPLIIPMVTTGVVTDITTESARCKCNVSAEGDCDVDSRGICWSTVSNPTLNNYWVTSGSGLGEYTCEMTDLESNTTYYVCAFAKYSGRVKYGEQRQFKTGHLPTFLFGDDTYYVAPDPGYDISFNNAQSYCANLSYLGLSEWTAPTKDQLIQMYAFREQIGGFSNKLYWTNQTWTNNYVHYVYVDFSNGEVGNVYVYSGDYVENHRIRPIKLKK